MLSSFFFHTLVCSEPKVPDPGLEGLAMYTPLKPQFRIRWRKRNESRRLDPSLRSAGLSPRISATEVEEILGRRGEA
jgi:hypothetical protein